LLDEVDACLSEDSRVRAASLAARARVEINAGRARDAWRHYAGAAKLLEETDREAAASALARAALAALVAGDHNDAVSMAAAARASLDDRSTAIAGAISALILGYSLWRSGSTAEGVSLLIPAAEFAERPNPDEPEYGPFAALILVLIGAHGRAESILEPLIDEARGAGALGVLPWALYVFAYLDIRRGRWSSAYASASEAVEIAVETGGAMWRCLALSSLVMLEGSQGREQECRNHAHEALTLAEELGIKTFMHDVDEGLGLLELVLGDVDRAIEALERSIRVPGGRPTLQLRPSMPDLVEAYARVGHPRARQLAQLAGEHTENIDTPELSALAARCRGLVAADDDFEQDFDDALRLFGAAELPFPLARTALNYGERLRRIGRRREARARLHAARDIFDRLGATPWSERAESELRATGERIRRREPTASDQLTAQELQIALAVARGATNREAAATLFVSHKTVERHLSVIYRKLGLRSRSELARVLATEATADTAAP
jgi:DNA-binding CsgD family transcriptional regulator